MKIRHGTPAWFEMVGRLMTQAAQNAALAPDLNVSLVERYLDGVEWAPGLVQGLRFEIVDGRPSFRIGARPGEQADIVIEVTAAASRLLNTLYGDDPAFQVALHECRRDCAFRIEGDLTRLGDWFGAVHDRIVEQTH